jgi:hypothetical protein
MIRAEKVVSALPPIEDFKEWEWGDGDLSPFLDHIRMDTAKIITDQIADNCEARVSESTGIFNVWPYGIDCEFVIRFDIFKALAEGQIEFDELATLKKFTAEMERVVHNLNSAIKIAEGGTLEPTEPLAADVKNG